jgi:hypothetical protein
MLRRAHVVSGREQWSGTAEHNDPDLVILFGPSERVVEFDEKGPVLSIAVLRPVERDPRDGPVTDVLIENVLVTVRRHDDSSSSTVMAWVGHWSCA